MKMKKMSDLGLGCSNKPATLKTLTQRQRYVNKMCDSCPSNLDGEVLPLRFGCWPK